MFSKEQAKQLRLDFWHKLDNRSRKLPGQKGEVRKWILDNTGIKGIDLRFDVNRKKATVALEINHRDEDRRLILYAKLDACKNIFESTFGAALNWDLAYQKNDDQHVSRVYVEMDGDIYQQEQWPEMIKFLVNSMVRMEEAFGEVKDFLKYDELGQ